MKQVFPILLLVTTLGCDLPGIPNFRPLDLTDVGLAEDVSLGVVVCPPSSRRCVGNSVRVCSADGSDFAIDACGLGETCAVGQCQPIQNTCLGDQPFALSATDIAFDVTTDLKAQSKQVRLANCGTSPIILRDGVVRGPARPDGQPVFELATDIGQSSIAPGSGLDIKVVYRPTPGLSHVAGRLELSLILDELTNVELGLRSKALCVSSTPFLDLGLVPVGTAASGRGRIQNCGTEPLEILGWEGPVDLQVTLDELPANLSPGEELGFNVSTTASSPTLLDANVTVALSDPRLEPTTRLRGLAVEPDCLPIELFLPQVLANNVVRLPDPGSLVRITFPGAPTTTLHWIEMLDQPAGSVERFDRIADGWTIRPRIIGTYRASVRGFDTTTGAPSCDSSEFSFDVLPTDGLHVELVWVSTGDGIVDDLGFGHSANLDLHVLSTRETDGEWNRAEYDCFPGAIGPCGLGRGSISVSQGGLPEFVHFGDPTGLDFEVGVYLSNPFNFAGTVARLRVFRDRDLVAEISSESLQTANDFWLVGRWNEESATWTEIDTVFSGFPL